MLRAVGCADDDRNLVVWGELTMLNEEKHSGEAVQAINELELSTGSALNCQKAACSPAFFDTFCQLQHLATVQSSELLQDD